MHGKCKHGLLEGTCSLCLGWPQTGTAGMYMGGNNGAGYITEEQWYGALMCGAGEEMIPSRRSEVSMMEEAFAAADTGGTEEWVEDWAKSNGGSVHRAFGGRAKHLRVVK